jgi:hypothetical protein
MANSTGNINIGEIWGWVNNIFLLNYDFNNGLRADSRRDGIYYLLYKCAIFELFDLWPIRPHRCETDGDTSL